jgi:putative ABC transport system permease protein
MRGSLYLAARYLVHHRGKTAVLVSSIGLLLFLPACLQLLVARSARDLTARADATPLLVGAKGSALELVLSSLYFDSGVGEWMHHREVDRIAETGLALPIPLHVRFRAGGHPVIGTTLDYFDFRALRIERGRAMSVLGECVLGAGAARGLGLGPGDHVVTSPESVFDLAGVYPLKLRIVGVAAHSGTPDDEAIFVDVKTAWVVEGLGHGHRDLAGPGSDALVLAREDGRITANAAVVEYNEITADNQASFHFHGDLDDHPVSAVIAVPTDERARVLLMGRYESPDERVQVLRPVRVMDELMATIFAVQGYVLLGVGVVGAATLATIVLVFVLSLRLRRQELETMHKLGAARGSVHGMLISEVVVVLALGLGLAAALTWATSQFGDALIRRLLLA